MALDVEKEYKYVLDVQAANKLSEKTSIIEREQIMSSAKIANRILTKENYYLILQETKKFYPYQDRDNYDRQVEYANRLSWTEYVHEGVLGLHQAILRFETSKGYRLSSFAVTWIRGSISCLRRKQVKIDLSYEQAEKDNLTLCCDLESVSISSQELELILSFVNTLNSIDRDIINRYFGLNNYQKNSLIAIGRCNNLSPKQVARRRDRILKKLRILLTDANQTEQTKALLHCLSNDISLLAS